MATVVVANSVRSKMVAVDSLFPAAAVMQVVIEVVCVVLAFESAVEARITFRPAL